MRIKEEIVKNIQKCKANILENEMELRAWERIEKTLTENRQGDPHSEKFEEKQSKFLMPDTIRDLLEEEVRTQSVFGGESFTSYDLSTALVERYPQYYQQMDYQTLATKLSGYLRSKTVLKEGSKLIANDGILKDYRLKRNRNKVTPGHLQTRKVYTYDLVPWQKKQR